MSDENTTADELEEIAEKVIFGQHVLEEILGFVNHKRIQKGQTTEQIQAHAKESNARAKLAINNL